MTAVDYAGIFIFLDDVQKVIKLCDTVPFSKPSVSFQESQVKTMVKALVGDLRND